MSPRIRGLFFARFGEKDREAPAPRIDMGALEKIFHPGVSS